MWAFSSCSEGQGLLFVAVRGLLIVATSLAAKHGPEGVQASVAAAQSVGSLAVAPGLAALQQAGSSWSRDQTCVSCIGRWVPNHWTAREAP